MPSVGWRPDWPQALLLIGGVTLWRLGTLWFDQTDLWVDESQYWLWSQNLDWGYFSKPPMIAFVLRATTELAGSDSAFWIRVNGSVLHASTAVILGATAARFYDRETGALVAMGYVTLPFVTLGSWLFSTDTVLLPFFALALLAYSYLREGRSVGWAIVFGAAIGCGFLSKYAVIYLPVSLSLAALLIPTARIAWRDAAIAAVTALVVAAPNLIWNVVNDGTTVRHIVEDNAKIGDAQMDPTRALEFLLSQMVVFGPVFFAALIAALWLLIRRSAPPLTGLLALLTLTSIGLMTVQAARVGANANWAVTAYAAGTILATVVLMRTPRLLMASLALQLALALAFPVAYLRADTLRQPNGRLLAERYLGTEALSQEIAATARTEGLTTIVAIRRGVLADLFHTLRDSELVIHAPAPKGPPGNYYEQVFPLPATTTGDVIFVAAQAPCPRAQKIHEIAPESGIYRGEIFRVFRAPASCLNGAR